MIARKTAGSSSPKKPKKHEKPTARGLVLSVLGKGYTVAIGEEEWSCRVRGRLFSGDKKTRPVVGDWVQVEARKEPLTGVINAIEPRRSALTRRFPETGREQVLAANIDQVLVCIAIKDPPFRPGLVDRYLITCELLGLQPTIVLNKIDLATEAEIEAAMREFVAIGYQVIQTSAKEEVGVEQLKQAIEGRCSVFTGPSGAGKSSLTNAIQPGLQLSTGDVNTVTGKGRHTTTVSQLIPLADGFVMDTPGIREFAPELIICVSLSGRNFKALSQRADPLYLEGKLKPDMGSLTLSSLNFNQTASLNAPSMVKDLARTMKELGILPELEAFDVGMINYAHYLQKKGLLDPPFYFNLLLGNIACAQATLLHAGMMVNELPEASLWSLAGIGSAQLKMNSTAIAMGGGVRVGLEDNFWYDTQRTELATNTTLLERIHNLSRVNERQIMTPAELRKHLNLKPGNGSYGR